MRVLLLGGTSEARALAALLEPDPAFDVVSSLAGRVTDPALPVGDYVIGGFGGVDGLVTFLRDRSIDAVVDATHPFARTMSANAVSACQASAVPLLALRRPGWDEVPGDRWHRVASVAEGAEVARNLTAPNACVFVTTGRQELKPFADDRERHYLIRSVDPPATALPPRHTASAIEFAGTLPGSVRGCVGGRRGSSVVVMGSSGGVFGVLLRVVMGATCE